MTALAAPYRLLRAIVVVLAASLLPLAPGMARAAGEPDFNIFFDFGAADIMPAAGETLENVVLLLEVTDFSRLIVAGRADTDGSDAQNIAMSKRRAEAVASFLEQRGIPRAKMDVTWIGERELALLTDDGVREPLNRVVELTIVRE